MGPLRNISFRRIIPSLVCFLYLFVLLVAQILPVRAVEGTIQISEIMYDAPGKDTNQEWIELHNSSGSAIDLANWNN